MRKITLLLVFAIVIFSCNNSAKVEPVVEEVKSDSTAPPPPPPVDLPFKATYSSDWSIGDPKYTKIALDFYKRLEKDSLSGDINYLEDTVHFRSFDNDIDDIAKEDLVQGVKEFRKGFKSLSEEFAAFTCLHSNDKNEDWVSLWIFERGVRANGKKDSTRYQENWRFRNGKVYFIADFARYKPKK
jgi:hypothetical protein